MNFPSKLIENAVEELAKLPGIGRKTALRLALHLLKEESEDTFSLAESLVKTATGVVGYDASTWTPVTSFETPGLDKGESLTVEP